MFSAPCCVFLRPACNVGYAECESMLYVDSQIVGVFCCARGVPVLQERKQGERANRHDSINGVFALVEGECGSGKFVYNSRGATRCEIVHI